MIMLDPYRTFAPVSRPAEPRVEPRVEPQAAATEAEVCEERLLRALRARVGRLRVERAPATLRERVRTLLGPRA
jgi:hypothetical protein